MLSARFPLLGRVRAVLAHSISVQLYMAGPQCRQRVMSAAIARHRFENVDDSNASHFYHDHGAWCTYF